MKVIIIITVNIIYECMVANISAIWQQAARTTHKLSSPSYSASLVKKKYIYKKWEGGGGEEYNSKKPKDGKFVTSAVQSTNSELHNRSLGKMGVAAPEHE